MNTKYIIKSRITNKDAQAIANELLPDDDTLECDLEEIREAGRVMKK